MRSFHFPAIQKTISTTWYSIPLWEQLRSRSACMCARSIWTPTNHLQYDAFSIFLPILDRKWILFRSNPAGGCRRKNTFQFPSFFEKHFYFIFIHIEKKNLFPLFKCEFYDALDGPTPPPHFVSFCSCFHIVCNLNSDFFLSARHPRQTRTRTMQTPFFDWYTSSVSVL